MTNNVDERELGEPISADQGYLHLTPRGWVRADRQPFPVDRFETWRWSMELPEFDAKERDRLTRVWVSMDWNLTDAWRLRAEFGDAITPNSDRTIQIQCEV